MDTITERSGFILNRAERAIAQLNVRLARTDLPTLFRIQTDRAVADLIEDYGNATDGDSVYLQILEVTLDSYTQIGLLGDF